MKIRVLCFAVVREKAGASELELDLDDHATVGTLKAALAKRFAWWSEVASHVRVAVGMEFATDDTALHEGAEVALIPPVSGGSGAFVVQDDPLQTEEVTAKVRRRDAGALVVFEGTVRDHTGDLKVSRLEYEAYTPMAVAKLEQVGGEVRATWPRCQIAISHRVGVLNITESAVVIAVSSPHRKEAFEACSYAIDRIKEIVPIWKKEVRPDGSVWIGMGS